MLRKRNKMDNKHDHEEDGSNRSTVLWVVLGSIVLTVALVIITMGYNLVVSSRELSEFQAFTVAVLSALVTAIGGLYVKIAYDKNKATSARMKHEETLETIRLQTNGRLHKRDEQLEDFRKMVGLLIRENRALRDELTVSTVAITGAVETIVNSESESLEELSAKIKEREAEIKKLPPFYGKEK